MNNDTKSNEELIKELELLKLDNNILKELYNKDIKECKVVEERRLKNDQKFNNLVSGVPVGIYMVRTRTSGDFQFEFISQMVEKIFNISADSALKDPKVTFQRVHPDDLPAFVELNEDRIKNPQPFEWEGRIIINEAIKWVQIASTPEKLENGDTLWHGVVIDINERKLADEKLKESRSDLAEAQHLAHIGSWHWSAQTNNLRWSKELYNIFGRDPDLPTPSHEEMPTYYTPESWTKLSNAINNTITLGESYELDLEIIRPDGSIINTITRGAPDYDSEGKLISLYGTTQDITERKKAEDESQQNKLRWEAIIEASPDGIGIITLDGKIQYISDKLIEMYGYTVEQKNEIIGSSPYDYIDPIDHIRLREKINNLLTGKSDQDLSEFLCVKKDGSRYYGEVNSTVLHDPKGNRKSLIFVQRDISRRKLAQAKFQHHTEEITNLYENSRDLAILPKDLDTLLMTITRRAIALLKRSDGGVYLFDKERGDLKVVVATNPLKLIGTRVKLGEGMAGRVAQTRQPMIIDDYMSWPHRLPVYENSPLTAVIEVPMLYRDELLGILVVEEYGETTRKFSEDDLRILTIFAGQAAAAVQTAQLFYSIKQINQELDQRVKELNIAKEEIESINNDLKELNSTKDKFFSIIAHDLRSPFQGLLNASEMLANDFENLPQKESAELIRMINERIVNVYKLIDNLLQWSLIQMQKKEYEPSWIDISNVINKTVIEIFEEAEKKGIVITNQVIENTLVFTDINIFQTIIRNLIANSIKFSYPGGSVTVSSVVNETFIELIVSDEGTGIKAEIIENLFFVDKSHTTIGTSGEKGTGLGLPLCKEFVKTLGGKIWVESVVGKGSTFHFTIPKSNLVH